MGDHEGWAQPSGLLPNGLLPNEASTGVTRVLDSERWAKAEERTAELIARIQPSRPSEERRNAVANYVRRLIMRCFSCHVFTFGSVPLKTYLPDGDIDLTAFSRIENVKDHWAKKVRDVLKNEEISENAEFHVKEVQYIEAEVQIIKCLVENIVVDISFNQVGGLCTLCFLDEIDILINNDYLFKRSIILIKAWCYYESRLLGAHHGLISTYALEMLVLYIFNVFNNSFAGPLEVLYRFLEFFSNFDWDNFCVSLWGPVPISSLPDMRAEPPRKDSGRLLFNDFFLAYCNKVYAAKPPDNQGQSFVPKHFNVIDPLRTNNNLGRSVSKGNFFRIRSAFAFGAKKLARIFECPKEDLIVEVNQFFMNTWERHGSGNRPDAPISYHVRPSKSLHIEDSSTSRNTSNTKKRGEDLSSQGSIPQVINFINQNNLYGHKTWTPSFSNTWTPSLTQYQRSYANNIVSRDSDQLDRTATNSSGSLQPDKSVKNLKPDYSFARTRSSPELTDTSAEISSRIQPNRIIETGNTQISHARLRKNSSSEVSGHNTRPSFDDPSFLRHSSSHQSLEASTEANSVSNSFHDEACLLTTGEELPSVSEALELEQEEQDLVNMMASRLHTFNGQLPLPMHLTSSHIPLHLSPVLASMSYGQRNLAGMVPGNFTLIDHSWGSGMQFPQGFVSSPLSPYFASGSSLSSNTEELESGNESSSLTELNPEDSSDQGRGFDSDNGGAQVLHLDDKQHPLVGPFNNFVPSTLGSNPGASFIQGQQQKIAEPKAQVLPEAFPYDRNPKSKVLPTSQACSSQSKSSSESSRDGASTKIPKSSRDKWGRKPGMNTGYGGAKSGWQVEGSSGHVSLQDDEDNREWVPLSTVSTEMVDGNPRNHQSPGYEPTQQISGDSMIPIAPMVVGNSRQRADNNSGVVPIAFYPTGPPVPFLTVLPVPLYNFQSDSGNPNGSSSHFDKDGVADSHVSASDQNFEATDNFDQSEPRISSAAEPSDERKSDILHSDFASHWQNLQYARLCQTNHNQGSLIYPSPVTMPPVYLQGNIPWEGPGRPVSGNMNLVAQVMGYGGPQLVPVAPLQSGPNNPTGVFQRYGDEAPRFRGGTGTYLPNPKVPFRDRQFPSSRNHRGNYNYDRSDQSDREGSWITAKARAAGRSHGRSQAEKQSTRSDRLGPTDKRPNRPWDSYRHETVASHRPQNTSFGSSNSSHASPNMPYGMYSVSGVSSNGVGPSVVMLYPYDQGAGYGPSSESLEFGSLGPVQLPSVHEVSHGSDGNLGRRVHEQRHGTYQGNSPRSSPDQPSSPHIQRGL